MRNFPQLIGEAAQLSARLELQEEMNEAPCATVTAMTCEHIYALADDLNFMSFALMHVAYRHRRRARAQDAARTLPYR